MSMNRSKRSRNNTIDTFFKSDRCAASTPSVLSTSKVESSPIDKPEGDGISNFGVRVTLSNLERDPGKRPPMWEYALDQRDEIRRAYIKMGPFQFHSSQYPHSNNEKNPRRFVHSWFAQFSSWLEYSPITNAAYCLPCYLFSDKPTSRCGANAFTTEGFRSWKKVNDGKRCAFLSHVGDTSSPHSSALRSCEDLMNPSRHIDKVMHTQSRQQILNNRLRLKTSIDCVRWLASQSCSFRGHDEGSKSINRGNFLELVKILASYNAKVRATVLDNAPSIAKYTSPQIQKEILSIIASKVRKKIREDIGESKFCILVDEARDESKKEQMALILRYVDKTSILRERFFDIVKVKDTTSPTLKRELLTIFSRHTLNVGNLRGQGYDGASNMSGEWNGLQALFLNDCPYAYYVHCFAHRLQLALVKSSRDVNILDDFFSYLDSIVNIVGASCKLNGELITAQQAEISRLISIKELETGRGANQIGTLQRAGSTRWGSHFSSVCSLINMFSATEIVLKGIADDGSNSSQRGEARRAYANMTSFHFIFVLLLMKKVMGISDILCEAMQKKSQDILNAMNLVSSTKDLLQQLRNDGWDTFLEDVKLFCAGKGVEMPDMDSAYKVGRGKSIHQERNANITFEHHFRVDIFVSAIDNQLKELNCRFNDQTVELLSLSCALSPMDTYKSFKIEDICTLAEKYYPEDFTDQDRVHLEFQLPHYYHEVTRHPDFCNLSTIVELCETLAKTKKSEVYNMVDRLIRLILLLPVSTATTERAFSIMKLTKTKLRNKMENEFLGDCMLLHIEKEIVDTFSSDSIVDDFYAKKNRRSQF